MTDSSSTSRYSVTGTIICGNNLLIASQPPMGINRSPLGARYYLFKVEQDGTLVRDYVPVYRKRDLVVGFYDYVYNKFYAPVVGTFIAGDEV